MKNLFEGRNPVVMGLYIGVILGALVMMIAGGLGYTRVADMALVSGVILGTMVGGLINFLQSRKAPKDREEPTNGAGE